MIKLIVAVGPSNLIGCGTKLCWHIPAEFKHFKESTIGDALLFGKTTFINLPSKLTRRTSYVLSADNVPGADVTVQNNGQLKQIFKKFRHSKKILWIAGGKSVYEQFYRYADELIVSEVKTNAKGEIFLEWDLSGYTKTPIKFHEQFTVYRYRKITPRSC